MYSVRDQAFYRWGDKVPLLQVCRGTWGNRVYFFYQRHIFILFVFSGLLTALRHYDVTDTHVVLLNFVKKEGK
jgi:hypothetical protein